MIINIPPVFKLTLYPKANLLIKTLTLNTVKNTIPSV